MCTIRDICNLRNLCVLCAFGGASIGHIAHRDTAAATVPTGAASITITITIALLALLLAMLVLVLVLPPIEVPAVAGPEREHTVRVLASLAQAVDRLSVMTYDRAKDGGAIAPINWVRGVMSSLQGVAAVRGKLLLGLPFYGWRSDGQALTGGQLVTWLVEEDVLVKWDPRAQEHVWEDRDGRRASYPSPAMLAARLRLVGELGLAGVAVWELGQGVATSADLF